MPADARRRSGASTQIAPRSMLAAAGGDRRLKHRNRIGRRKRLLQAAFERPLTPPPLLVLDPCVIGSTRGGSFGLRDRFHPWLSASRELAFARIIAGTAINAAPACRRPSGSPPAGSTPNAPPRRNAARHPAIFAKMPENPAGSESPAKCRTPATHKIAAATGDPAGDRGYAR